MFSGAVSCIMVSVIWEGGKVVVSRLSNYFIKSNGTTNTLDYVWTRVI